MQRKNQFDALLYKKHPALYCKHIWQLPPLDYYAIVLAFVAAVAAIALGAWIICALAAAVWAALTGRFLGRQLRGTSHAPAHVLEMLITSLFIPFSSVFWRLWGALKFRVWFC
jgi:hypothetical protein